MTDPNFRALLQSIRRCNAVYEPDNDLARNLFHDLGSRIIARLSEAEAQAVLNIAPDGMLTLTVSGTRVSAGPLLARFMDVFEDAEEVAYNTDIGGGAIVASGAWHRAGLIWAWAQPFVGTGGIRIEGHSLGGQTTHALLAMVPQEQIAEAIAWEAPKAGNDAFWARVQATVARRVTVLHGRDPWADHPIASQSLRHDPGQIVWLQPPSTWGWTTRDAWPGADWLCEREHNTEQVEATLAGLCGETGSQIASSS
jgi:hypothetical protein